jgi:hypothetical protein
LHTPTADEIPVGGRNVEIISGFASVKYLQGSVHNFRPRSGSVGPPTGLSSFVGAPGIFIKEDYSIPPGNICNNHIALPYQHSANDYRFVNRLQ